MDHHHLGYEHKARKKRRVSGAVVRHCGGVPTPLLLWCAATSVPVAATTFNPLGDSKYIVLDFREPTRQPNAYVLTAGIQVKCCTIISSK